MATDLSSLPITVIVMGTQNDHVRKNNDNFGTASLQGCADFAGNMVIPIWQYRSHAKLAQPQSADDFIAFTITDLIAGLTPTNQQRIFLYCNPTASQMEFDSDNFEISELEASKLYLLPVNLDSALSAYEMLLGRKGEGLDRDLVLKIRSLACNHPALKLIRLIQLCLEDQEELRVAELNELLSTWDGEMQCEGCGYLWKSRRPTPPAQCPKCHSNAIRPLFV